MSSLSTKDDFGSENWQIQWGQLLNLKVLNITSCG
jgi:hypothetical protein